MNLHFLNKVCYIYVYSLSTCVYIYVNNENKICVFWLADFWELCDLIGWSLKVTSVCDLIGLFFWNRMRVKTMWLICGEGWPWAPRKLWSNLFHTRQPSRHLMWVYNSIYSDCHIIFSQKWSFKKEILSLVFFPAR